jgi:hypothetical protein
MSDGWVCVVEWIQVSPSEGGWFYDVYLLHEDDAPEKINHGVALFKWHIYLKVWRVCRKHGLKFRPWSKAWQSGELPKEDDD